MQDLTSVAFASLVPATADVLDFEHFDAQDFFELVQAFLESDFLQQAFLAVDLEQVDFFAQQAFFEAVAPFLQQAFFAPFLAQAVLVHFALFLQHFL